MNGPNRPRRWTSTPPSASPHLGQASAARRLAGRSALRGRACGGAAGRRAGQLARFLVLGVHRAGQELAVAAEPDDHRVALRAELVRRSGREVGPAQLLGLLLDASAERRVELPDHRHPGSLAVRDVVEVVLHAGRELEVHELAEVADQQVRHDLADRLRVEPPFL